jgi:hypothetical protein
LFQIYSSVLTVTKSDDPSNLWLLMIECTTYPFYKNQYFLTFIVNSSVLIPNLLELFFSDKWIRFYGIRKAPCQKTTFLKINFTEQYFWGFIAFLYTSIWRELPKKFFWLLSNFDRNIPKIIFFWAYVMRRLI